MADALQQEIARLQAELHKCRETARTEIMSKDDHIMELEALVQQHSTEVRRLQEHVTIIGSKQMVTALGTIEPYDRKTDWSQWLQRLEHYTATNSVASNKHKELFLSILGAEGYALLSNLCAPIDKNGIHVCKDKVEAINAIKTPLNTTELKRFLGMTNYYSKFVNNYAQVVAPLYKLLRKEIRWNWTEECQVAFDLIKEKLLSPEVLMHYDPKLPLKITCDASPVGVGAVLSHILPNNIVRPVASNSRSLTVAERNYAQLDREALALVFGVKSFHQYVWGRKFWFETDYKPLKFIFDPNRSLPNMVAGRVQRWAVFLASYDFILEHIKGTDNGSADCLSRTLKPMVEEADRNQDFSYLNFIESEVPTLDIELIRTETKRDETLSKVIKYVRDGWPKEIKSEFEIFKRRQNELYVEDDCLMLGMRVVVPIVLRSMVLSELHVTHMGIVRMKAMARSFVWWPGIDSDIDKITKTCQLCLENASNPPRSELNVWKWPEGPNQRIHIDYLQIKDKMYLVIIDSFSKWIDVKAMKDITSRRTILAMSEYFATWGFPNVLVSDNGPSLISEEFESFLKRNGILHVKTAPYHPASNGAAENVVKTFKRQFKLLQKNNTNEDVALTQVLMSYRSTPHCTTGYTPAELQTGRPMRARLDLLKPYLRNRVVQQQARQKYHAPGSGLHSFDVGEVVMAKDHLKNIWIRAEVVERHSPVTYIVRTANRLIWKRHVDQLRPTLLQEKLQVNSEDSGTSIERNLVPSEREGSTEHSSLLDNVPEAVSPMEAVANELPSSRDSEPSGNSSDPVGAFPPEKTISSSTRVRDITKTPTPTPVGDPELRRSSRIRRPVQRLNL
ncbi:uncharacterized protein K02A2.6-like [Diachasma alloeum]|uniref:uncharacterized protein K02A2.6-like n=1 Tax=Diachasma alloeum TaxID=454923 RepID=UPI0007384DE8|nr:uncharacterized protein K02A2.6-like [Diachasma alloeum]